MSERVVREDLDLYEMFEPEDMINAEEGTEALPFKEPVEPVVTIARQTIPSMPLTGLELVRDAEGDFFMRLELFRGMTHQFLRFISNEHTIGKLESEGVEI